MIKAVLALGLMMASLGVPQTAEAALITFNSRAAFDLAAGPLPTETFEEGNVGAGQIVPCPAPLDASSNNSCFTPGEILAGLQLTVNPTSSSGLALTGDGFSGINTEAVFANVFSQELDLIFSASNAVGADLYSEFSSSILNVSVFGTTGLLGVFQVAAINSGAGTFFGVISTGEPIVRIHLASQVGAAEGVDNVSFGTIGARQVPEPGSLALLGLGLAGACTRMHRRRRTV